MYSLTYVYFLIKDKSAFMINCNAESSAVVTRIQPPKPINMYWLLTALLLTSATAFETCEECLANIVSLGDLINEHKVKQAEQFLPGSLAI
jgi:hypothetical protein